MHMDLLNLLDLNALKILITFSEFEGEICRYEETARKCNITICLSNPQDLIRHLERKLAEFRTLREKCFTKVTFKHNEEVLSVYESERYMLAKLDMIKSNHKFL